MYFLQVCDKQKGIQKLGVYDVVQRFHGFVKTIGLIFLYFLHENSTQIWNKLIKSQNPVKNSSQMTNFLVMYFFFIATKCQNSKAIKGLGTIQQPLPIRTRGFTGAPVDVWTCPHRVFAATLTLSQPGGADYAHPILVFTPSFESHRRA